ncbi:MAG: hypothetical protein IT431_01840 [Phycisphaerales bacterium]|nr:hypothetical protein [Phycisphaerales bacterium]
MRPISAFSRSRSLAVWGALLGPVGLAASAAAGQGDWKLVELPFYSYAQMQLMQRTPGQATCLYQPNNSVLAVDIAADGTFTSRQVTPDDPAGMVVIYGLQPDGVLTGWERDCGGDADHRTLLWIDPDGTKTRTLCGQIGWVVGSFEDGTIMSSAYRDNKPLIFGTRDGGRVDVSIPAEWEDSLGFNFISDGGGSGWLGGGAFKDSGQGTVVFTVIWDRATGRFIPIDEASFGYPSGTEVRVRALSGSSIAVGLLRPDQSQELDTVWMWRDADGDAEVDPEEVTPDLVGDQAPPGSKLSARDVNEAGDVLLADISTSPSPLYLWSGGTLIPVQSFVPGGSVFEVFDPSGTMFNYMLTDEGWIMCWARHTGTGEFTAAVLIPPSPDTDTDGDGLLDDWEDNGIPYTGVDGVEKRYILPGADKSHKTLYVEVDTMPEAPFTLASKRLVERAFAQAPVQNPDGTTGIDLFIQVDEPDLPTEAVSVTPDDDFPLSASVNKGLFFGAAEERADPDRVPMLEAKAKAFRYALGYREASGDMGGLGELGGDDFVMFAEGYSDLDYAAVFMHELGHNLNLDHGGHDDINRKPNYPSIMNYALSYRQPWNRRFWRLDFSREELSVLNEAALDEQVSVGFGGSGHYRSWRTPWYGTPPFDSVCYADGGIPAVFYAPLDIATGTDFDLDCDTNDFNITVDLNHDPLDPDSEPSPGEIMHGTDDWSFMTLAISPDGAPFGGAVPKNELTNADRDHINATFPEPEGACAGDWNDDGAVNTLDVLAFLNDWAAAEYWADLNLDGQVNTLDVLAFLNDWTVGC